VTGTHLSRKLFINTDRKEIMYTDRKVFYLTAMSISKSTDD
jgi:hypothetical protein